MSAEKGKRPTKAGPLPDNVRPLPKTPPHDLDAERGLIGLALMGTDHWEAATGTGLAVDAFYSPHHQRIWRAALEMGPTANAILVAARLFDNGHRGPEYETGTLATYIADTPAISMADRYAALVAEHAGRRRLIYELSALADAAFEQPYDVLAKAVETHRQSITIDAPTIADYPTQTVAEMAAEVAAAPAPTWLLRGLMSAGDYGTLAASRKAGKSLMITDLAVNVAAGGKFLGHYPCDTAGPVLMFAGEGGKRKLIRRLKAVAEHYGHDLEQLEIHIHDKAPKVAVADGLSKLRATVARIKPVLIIIDPAYLALGSQVRTGILTDMGELLEHVQHIAAEHHSALLFTHHWNKTGTSQDPFDRFTGSGFAEWSRVMMSVAVKGDTYTDPATGRTRADVEMALLGDEIPASSVRFRRHVWTDNPDDLASAMHYTVQILETPPPDPSKPDDGLRPGQRSILEALGNSGHWFTHHEIRDRLAQLVPPVPILSDRTLPAYAGELVDAGLLERQGEGARGNPYRYRRPPTVTP